jgi:YVTN family beta-propeller protein
MKTTRSRMLWRPSAIIALLFLALSLSTAAQILVDTVNVGTYPMAVAINPVTNKAYVANQTSNNVTIINGTTYNTSLVVTGSAPDALAVNAVTNKIYISNADSNSVTVLDGVTNETLTVSVGDYPIAIAVNSMTNKIDVANYYANSVTVIDGATNNTTSVATGSHPVALAINSATNQIYVAAIGSNNVTIINGATNSTATVSVGAYPRAIAIDEYANLVYVVNYSSNDVSVINGATDNVTAVSVGNNPVAVDVNPAQGQVYVANTGDDTATIIDEATLATTTVGAGISPATVVVDPATNKAYLTNLIWDGTVTMIDGANDSTTTVYVGIYPIAIAINLQMNTIYVADTLGNTVSVVSGASSDPLQFTPITPCRIADTRNPNGPFGGPYLSGGEARSFPILQSTCNVPSAALAYSLNVTVLPAGRPLNYLTIWPSGESQPVISTLNSPDGRIRADAAIVPAGVGGAVSVYVTDPTNLILDIDGYFQAPAAGTLQFFPLPPCRVLDTRSTPGSLGGPYLTGGQERDFPVLESNCQIPEAAEAYSMNFTVVPWQSRPLSYLTVWPAGQQQPLVSTLNNPTATVVANAAIVPAGTNGAIAVYPAQDTNLIADINGYFAQPGPQGLSLYTTPSCRVIDTRQQGGAFSGQRNPPVNVSASGCGVVSSAEAYVFNVTVMPIGPLGYLTLWANGAPRPGVSTLNAAEGVVTSNMAIVGNLDAQINAFAYGTTQLIMDISNYFGP